MQVLPHGEAILSFGSTQYITEFSKRGGKKKNGHAPVRSRTAEGRRHLPRDALPVVGDAEHQARGRRETRKRPAEVAVYVSWNGATEVAKWEVLAGEEANALAPVTTAEWSNFETRIPVSSTDKVFEVKALDKEGKVLATSEAVNES